VSSDGDVRKKREKAEGKREKTWFFVSACYFCLLPSPFSLFLTEVN
jgi:hypothetical protein